MPLWAIIASLIIAAVPGLAGLGVAWFRMGALHNEVKNIGERLKDLPSMASDIAYLKGRQDGADVASLALVTPLRPVRRAQVS